MGVEMGRILAALVITLGIHGCAYQVPTVSAPAVNVYSNYDDKVPGKYFLTVEQNQSVLKRDISASSYVCSAHKFPVDATQSFETSVLQTMTNIFDEVEPVQPAPTISTMQKFGAAGSILVKADTFQPRLSCSAGFWSGNCTSNVDLSIGVVVNSPSGRLLATSAGASRSVDVDAGGACEGGANAIAQAISAAIKESLERVAERLTNSPRLRPAGSGS